MVKHSLSDGGYKTRRDERNEVAQLLGVKLLREATPQTVDEARSRLPEVLFRRARHITTENQRTLMAVDALRRGAWTELGQLMYGSHLSLRDDFNVSCRELDIVVDEARAPEGKGVFGCRMTGGGFGGCCIALVDSAHATEIAGTAFDFCRPRRIRDGVDANDEQIRFAGGYDHNFVILPKSGDTPQIAARVRDPLSGRTLEVLTSEPGFQFYSGNFLDGTEKGKGGTIYAPVCAWKPNIFRTHPTNRRSQARSYDQAKSFNLLHFIASP
jgi:hypothetical protein